MCGLSAHWQFQYISCCYLSKILLEENNCYDGFNTSHVVIYPLKMRLLNNPNISFNTSHVVIYLKGIEETIISLLFQYISCCYLSSSKFTGFSVK